VQKTSQTVNHCPEIEKKASRRFKTGRAVLMGLYCQTVTRLFEKQRGRHHFVSGISNAKAVSK
jgi:hypothetical protein